MKKFLFLFVTVVCVALSGCKEDMKLPEYIQIDGIVYKFLDNLNLEVSQINVATPTQYKGDIVVSSSVYTLTISQASEVVGVGESAFYNCTELTSVSFPATINYVSKAAFANCTALQSITIRSLEPPTIDPTAFDGCDTEKITLYVFLESVDAYKLNKVWGKLNVKPYPLEDA